MDVDVQGKAPRPSQLLHEPLGVMDGWVEPLDRAVPNPEVCM